MEDRAVRFVEMHLRKGVEKLVKRLVQIDASLDYKLKALAKHVRICEELRHDIRNLESEKSDMYARIISTNGRVFFE